MSSDLFRQHLASADIDMLKGVLESAGMRGSFITKQDRLSRCVRLVFSMHSFGKATRMARIGSALKEVSQVYFFEKRYERKNLGNHRNSDRQSCALWLLDHARSFHSVC